MSEFEGMLKHAHWLQPLARGLLEDDHLADDVLQETWIAAWQRPPRDSEAGPAWLRQVVRNFAKMKFRGEGRRRQRERIAARPEARSDEQPLEALELRREIVRALLSLDEPFQSTLILRFYEGMSSAEIARLEGIPATTVRVRLKRGLDRLRDELADRRDDFRPGLLLLAGLEPLRSGGAPALVAEATASTAGDSAHPLYTARARWAAVAAGVLIVVVGWWSTSFSGFATTPPAVEGGRGFEAAAVGVGPAGRPGVDVASASPRTSGAGESAVVSRERADPTWVHVRVVDPSGSPVARARVATGESRGDRDQIAAGYQSAYEFLLAEPSPRLEGHTDRDGLLRVRSDHLRDRSIAVISPRHRVWRERPTLREFDDGELRVTLSPRSETEIVVEATSGTASIEGEIVVTSRFEAQHFRARSGERVLHTSPAEVELVSFRFPGMVAVQEFLASPRHRQVLTPGRVAYGTVLDPGGGPLVGAEVRMRTTAWRGPAHVVVTDHHGRFETFGLSDEGTLSLEVAHPHFPRRVLEFPLPCTELGEIAVEPAATLAGRAFGDDGEPLAGAVVHALPDGSFHSRDVERVITGDDGFFEFATLTAGRHTLRVEHAEHAPTEREVDVFAGELLRDPIAIHLERGRTLRGVVRTPDGSTVAGVPIRVGTIVGDELRGSEVRSGSDGRFELHHLPTGEVVHRSRRHVVRWRALPEEERAGRSAALLLEVFRPYQLLAVDDGEIPQLAHFGSRNTAAVAQLGSEIELVVAEPTPRTGVQFELVDREGDAVRAFSNVLIVSPHDWIMKDFAGVNGQPFHLPNAEVLDDAQLTVMSRGYCWRTERVDLRGSARRVRFVLTPRFETPPVLRIAGVSEERAFLVAPLVPGVEPLAALPVGSASPAPTGAGDATLVLEDLGPGRYALCSPRDPSALYGKSGKRRLAMTVDEVHFLGHFTLTEAEGQIVPISLSETAKEKP